MKKQLFNFLLLISLFANVSAQAAKQAAAKSDSIEQNLRKHVVYLASDKLEGRRTGEKGATFAAGYVANMFSNFRLKGGFVETKNGKSNASFLQPFPFVAGVETAKSGNEFQLFSAGSTGQGFQVDNLAAWKPAAFSPNAEVAETPIVFAGYGIVSGDGKRDDYAGLDVKNKIVLVFDGGAGENNPHSSFLKFDARTKAKIARDNGARALFIVTREAKVEDDRLAQMKYDSTLGESAVPTVIVSRRTAAAILGTDEKGLTGAEKEFTAFGKTFNSQTTAPEAAFKINLVKRPVEGYNVIGILEGNDPVLKNETIVIGAHYDHLGRGGEGSLAANSAEIHHGADDNASGVAALIELARQFSAEKKNKRTIIFIAFGGEEEGLIGSKFYVNNPVFPLTKTVAMINMDMVGRLKDNKLTVGGIGTASEWKNWVENINLLQNKTEETQFGDGKKGEGIMIDVKITRPFQLQLNEDGFGPSDHSSFYGKQIPVLFFFTGTHLDYHKPTDTADKINYAGLRQITNYVSEIVKTIDQNPKRPTYTIAKSSGTGEGRMGFNVSLGTIPTYADSTDGLVLDGVRDNSPAAKAGIKAGDKVIKLAGKEVRNVSDYTIILGEMKPDIEYEIVVVRGKDTLNLKIIPAARK